MRRYFQQLETKLADLYFQQFIIAFPSLAKTMIIPDNNGMRVEFFHQKLLHIIFRRLLRELRGKRHYHQVIDTFFAQQFYFFFNGINKIDGLAVATTLRGCGWKVMITVSPPIRAASCCNCSSIAW